MERLTGGEVYKNKTWFVTFGNSLSDFISLSLTLDMIERAIINTFVGHDVVEPGNYVQMFPYPCYTRDE